MKLWHSRFSIFGLRTGSKRGLKEGMARQVGEKTRQVGEMARQVGDTTRQVGVMTRQVGIMTRQVGDMTRQVGLWTRQVGQKMRQVDEKTRQVGQNCIEMAQNRLDLVKKSQQTSFSGSRGDKTQAFSGLRLLTSASAVRKVAAFTMIEIAIALAVIAFALVAIIGVLPTGLNVQKDNREDTIINQDGPFFLEAIRNGSRGLDYLTNYVDSITLTNNLGGRTIFTNAPGASSPYDGSMTNGERIIGILSIPKYLETTPIRTTNSIIARVRALTGSAVEQGTANPDFAFTYQLTSEVMPFVGTQVPVNSTNYQFINDTKPTDPDEAAQVTANRKAEWIRVSSREKNSSEIRLTFRWPLFQGDQTGPGRQSFRSIVSGARTNIAGLPFFLPQKFEAVSAP